MTDPKLQFQNNSAAVIDQRSAAPKKKASIPQFGYNVASDLNLVQVSYCDALNDVANLPETLSMFRGIGCLTATHWQGNAMALPSQCHGIMSVVQEHCHSTVNKLWQCHICAMCGRGMDSEYSQVMRSEE